MTKKQVRIPGNFEPVYRSKRRQEKPAVKVVTVPSGSNTGWKCCVCGRMLEPRAQCVKVGRQMYCEVCVRRNNNVR